ncbi:hypothetical protein, partial [Actinocorallia lasiicapitis]
LCAVAAVAIAADLPRGGTAPRTGELTVFNAERSCQDRTDRDPRCSLGLAIDPTRPYTPDNVVATRVWHGDTLTAECQLPYGLPIIDESGLRSTRWFWIRLPTAAAPPTAWLPAVRTRNHPPLPTCPPP